MSTSAPTPPAAPAASPARAAGEALLSAHGVQAGYNGTQILGGVSAQVNPGEVVLVIGPNGAGKSTLLKAIFGVIQPTAGSVRLGGVDITGQPPHRVVAQGMCYVPQTENVFPTLSVQENLEMGAFVRSGSLAGPLEQVYARFPVLKERAQVRGGALSGGERQMLAMAKALMLEPRVLLLDEPSAGLAPNLVRRIFDEVRRIADSGVAVLIVEQSIREALRIADRGYVLAMGENRFEGSAQDLIDTPDLGRLYLGR